MSPDVSGAVGSLAFNIVGPTFTPSMPAATLQFVGGVFRNKLAAIDPQSGVALTGSGLGSSSAVACRRSGSVLYVGGTFTSVGAAHGRTLPR